MSTTSATIEASINPEGAETSYEIWLECQGAEAGKQACESLTGSPQLQQGTLSAGFEAKVVTDEVTGLQPGYLYKYRVVATNSGGRAGYVGAGLITCPSEGSCPSQPYWPGIELWEIEGAERAAAEAPRLEAEREAKKREAEERLAREAAERFAREHKVPLPRCVVPRLKGDSLAAARHALRRAHCSVGVVTKPQGSYKSLVVVKQSVPGGEKRPAGSRVALTLGPSGKSSR